MARPAALICVAALALASCGRGDAPAKDEDKSVAAAAPVSTFDCGKAQSDAEKLVCSDAQLTGLDRETARLYALAKAKIEPVQLNELEANQDAWAKGRDNCWTAIDLRTCVVDAYAGRIHELRRGYSGARSADAQGTSSGPLVVECQGLEAAMSLIFIESEPNVANLMWLDRIVTLVQQESDSGEKYVGTSLDGEYVFWTHGDEATLSRPRGRDLRCTIEKFG